MKHYELLSRLAQPAGSRIVLLVLDGVGDVRTATQPRTALELASTPNLDDLAAASALGRLVPVAPGVTPGSGPGHLGLFGYDPRDPQVDIGRGVLEALGLDLPVEPGDVTARGNFATAGPHGELTDRRAGRIPTAESARLTATMQRAVDAGPPPGVEVTLRHGEGHRFVLRLRGEGLAPALADTDPQRLGVPPLPVRASAPEGEATAEKVARVVAAMESAIAGEPQANRVLLRGFSQLPHLPSVADLYRLRPGAFAGYPLYRGVASVCGMEVVPCGKRLPEILAAVAERWDDFDYFFLHVKQTGTRPPRRPPWRRSTGRCRASSSSVPTCSPSPATTRRRRRSRATAGTRCLCSSTGPCASSTRPPASMRPRRRAATWGRSRPTT
jgi:2,3-bisphosphoglycerate-independent phosphoglycerate mutase